MASSGLQNSKEALTREYVMWLAGGSTKPDLEAIARLERDLQDFRRRGSNENATSAELRMIDLPEETGF